MSIDLEDYYCDLPFSVWDKYPSRVVETTTGILDLLDKHKAHATFFTVGYIANKHPDLLEDVKARGHEIASHSYRHIDARGVTKEEFEADLVMSLQTLEKIAGEKIQGFRAPFFSIGRENLWIFEILRRYLKYDSSIFPTKTPLYGIPDAPRHIYHPSKEDPLVDDPSGQLIEIPMATLHFPLIRNIPIAGGFYLRFLPLQILKFGIRKMNSSNNPAMVYIHPKDLDRKMPQIDDYSWHYYWGLSDAERRFESLLREFRFGSVRDTILVR